MRISQSRPTHPGVFIEEDILNELDLTQQALANLLGVSRRTINQLVRGKRAMTADMALRLSKFTNTSAEFWLNLQTAVDLWDAAQQTTALDAIQPHPSLMEAVPSQ